MHMNRGGRPPHPPGGGGGRGVIHALAFILGLSLLAEPRGYGGETMGGGRGGGGPAGA